MTSSSSCRRLSLTGIGQLELLVEVAGVDLDVAGLVHHLRGAVVLGLDPRHLLHELGGGEQRALLAVEELRGHPRVERGARRSARSRSLKRSNDSAAISGR